MESDKGMPAERRGFPSTAVLEWRVSALERGQSEILTKLDAQSSLFSNNFDDLKKRDGRSWDRVILAMAAVGSAIAALSGVLHR